MVFLYILLMKHLKSYGNFTDVAIKYKLFESDRNGVMSYVKDILLELEDDGYLVKVSKIPYTSSFSISIKRKMSTGYSVVNISDVLPTIQHIVSYLKQNNFPYFLVNVQPLWNEEGHLIPILYKKIIDNIDNKYGEIRLTFTDVLSVENNLRYK